MKKLTELFKKWGLAILGVIAGIIVLFRFRDKLDGILSKEKLQKTNEESTRLETVVKINKEGIKRHYNEMTEKQEEADKAKPSEVEDFYKRR